MPATRVYIGLGSNLNDPITQIHTALQLLANLRDSLLLTHSSLYRNPAMGSLRQPAYVNAVAALDTQLPALTLLDELHGIEQMRGRLRTDERWGPRTLDLDILLYGEEVIQHPRLQVPHPGLSQRNFVLYPLQEIAPDVMIPGHGPLTILLDQCAAKGLERIAS
jgi:2-amino-4-hydroxy-6-hydroxymethyldihydropteridine diphosphokinase